MAIRPCRKEDLARIAEIHKSQFVSTGTLVGQLSPALIAALYEAFIDRSVFLVHSIDGEIDGFVLGGSSQVMKICRRSFYRKCFLFCMAEVVCRPRLWPLAFRSFLKLIGKRFAAVVGAAPPEEFRLVSIAVDKRATRNGIGTELVQAFEAAIRAACCTYSLNVLKTNTTAIRFYEKLAYQCVGETAIAWRLRRVLAANTDMPEAPLP